jgi:hypothetical protein
MVGTSLQMTTVVSGRLHVLTNGERNRDLSPTTWKRPLPEATLRDTEHAASDPRGATQNELTFIAQVPTKANHFGTICGLCRIFPYANRNLSPPPVSLDIVLAAVRVSRPPSNLTQQQACKIRLLHSRRAKHCKPRLSHTSRSSRFVSLRNTVFFANFRKLIGWRTLAEATIGCSINVGSIQQTIPKGRSYVLIVEKCTRENMVVVHGILLI